MKENEPNFQIEEDFADHHYRTEIPNCIFDAELSVYTLAVYSYLKRIAGDAGKCWQSNKKIASSLGISERQVQKSISELCSSDNKFKIPFIERSIRKNEDGGNTTNILKIVNIWSLNGTYYRSLKKSLGDAQYAPPPAPYAPPGAPYAYKEQPIKKNPIKNNNKPAAPVVVPFIQEEKKIDQKSLALIQPFGFGLKVQSELLTYSFEQIELAISAYSQQCKNKPISKGALITAIREGWKPNKTKKDTIEENIKHLKTLKSYDMKKIHQNTIHV